MISLRNMSGFLKLESVLRKISQSSNGRTINFLAIYDQSNALCYLFNTLCRHYNLPVIGCNKISAAMNILRKTKSHFDAVVIDIHLAELNAYEFIEFIKAEYNDILVLVTYDCDDAIIKANLDKYVNRIEGDNRWVVSMDTTNKEPMSSTSLRQDMDIDTASKPPNDLSQSGRAPRSQRTLRETKIQVPSDSMNIVINPSALVDMQTILEYLQSIHIRLKFLAVYDETSMAFHQFYTLCLHYDHQVTTLCNGTTGAIFRLLRDKSQFDAIAIDIRMAELNGFDFIQFVQTQINLPLHVTYDINDATIKPSLESAMKYINGGSNCWISSLSAKITVPSAEAQAPPPRSNLQVTEKDKATKTATLELLEEFDVPPMIYNA